MRRILCLYLPDWPIQRVLAGRRKDEGQSTKYEKNSFVLYPSSFVLLHARDPRRGLVVVAASDAATSAGVRIGMPLAEATTLAGKVQSSKFKVQGPETLNFEPGTLNCIAHDPAADLAELARLAEHCERFSPVVGWETIEGEPESKVQSPKSKVQSSFNIGPWTLDFGLFLDITGIGVLFGGEEQLAQEAVVDLARLGVAAQAAVAGTIGAAWGAAKYEGRRTKDEADGFALRPSSFVLPLTALRLPSETLDLLAQLGITRLGELLALPRASLRARFGERLLLRLDQLTGAAQETIVAHRPPPKFAAEWVLEYPAEHREIIEQIVRELVGRVALALAERREGVVQLHCRLDCGMGKPDACPTRIDVGLFRPSADARHLWDLVRMQLEQTRLPGPVGRVTLQALSTAPLENRQGELFAGGKDEADRQLGLLVDRLASRLGPEAVLHAQLTADPLPEKSSKYGKAVQAGRSKVQSPKSKVARPWTLDLGPWTRSSRSTAFRPLFLRPPLVLDAVSVVPDGPPIRFHYQGQQHRVAFHWGPERIETGWYRGASVRRDYYRVQTDEGLRFWLFRRLDDDKWCLHGEY